MSPSRGYYSLIQYCPDLGRLEAVNVGVLLFCPDREFLKARMSRDNSRVRQFFGATAYDADRLNSFKRGVVDRLEVERGDIRSLADLEGFIARRANAIQITPPRPIKVTDPEEDLAALYRELVDGRAAGERVRNMKTYLADKFRGAGLEDKIERDVVVQVPIFSCKLKIPYGYQNGRFNLIRPARFQSDDPKGATTSASRYAVEGRSIYETPDPRRGELSLVIVGDFGTRKAENLPIVRRILESHHVELYELERVDALVETIRRTAKELPAAS
ncbi:DUF3037 domain-containing protein [Paludisphaera rhizosphaerae]|uniref:DUF3037 domain-containing protein n=1 Tax=Paludisphaera rhizosphaerae TaxID=2711216 RepID=UPI0013EABCBD|nr:DUF3037 domain-containing protein [Paludisphaera rhizosphaerae]